MDLAGDLSKVHRYLTEHGCNASYEMTHLFTKELSQIRPFYQGKLHLWVAEGRRQGLTEADMPPYYYEPIISDYRGSVINNETYNVLPAHAGMTLPLLNSGAYHFASTMDLYDYDSEPDMYFNDVVQPKETAAKVDARRPMVGTNKKQTRNKATKENY